MRISCITLTGFRCFGSQSTTVDLNDFSAVVGTNGTGKTAILHALCRLFGTTSSARALRRSDFHVPSGQSVDEFDELSLSVEVRLELSELKDDPPKGTAVPECFNQMVIAEEGATPFCRLRLEGTWRRSNTEQGDIEESVYWISTPDEEVKDNHKRVMRAFERSRIHVVYIPAVREPGKQIRQASGSMLGRVLRAIKWSDAVSDAVEKASTSVLDTFRQEAGITAIENALHKAWKELQDFSHLDTVQLHPLSTRFDELLRNIQLVLGADEDTVDVGTESLSEGQKSLFYFALLVATFELESTLTKSTGEESPFDGDSLEPPSLTVFAVEEPENHLAPHYLRRICDAFVTLSQRHTVQVLLTSHSPAILARVDPEDIRHIRAGANEEAPVVRHITLPEETDEAYKYVKEAVRAYPELYFSRLVILGEGDSEEIVLRRLAEANDVPADRSFVSVVPLGGRHVNHFWRLLNDLQIPFITLLDLDRERDGGGWGRIKYACLQLRKIGVSRKELFTVSDGAGGDRILPRDEVRDLHTWDVTDVTTMNGWATSLERFGVFFSSPLDLDFLMLSAFTDEYQATADRGPRIPKKPSTEFDKKVSAATTATLKASNSGGDTYSDEEREMFIWYAYLFLGKGKPTTHLLALDGIDDNNLRAQCPPVLKRMVKHMKLKL